MKVAIIGAGIAGLSCAFQFEKYKNISVDLYEANSYIGDNHNHVTAIMRIFHKSHGDSMKYFRDKLGLEIEPLHKLNRVIHFSPNNKKVINGDLGYFLSRGRMHNSVKNQIYRQLDRTNVIFNTCADYRELQQKYDYVILANGDINYTNELGCYQEWISPLIVGATVYGDFRKDTLKVWFNRKYCHKGYVYLTPFNENKAFIGLVVTDIKKHEAYRYFKLFLAMENIENVVDEEFIIKHKTGFVYPHNFDNLYFVGSAAGGIDPFLGFGQMNAFITGAKAAKSIALEKNYENLIKNQVDLNLDLYELRNMFNHIYNHDYNKLLNIITFPGIHSLLYKSNIDFIKYGCDFLRLKRNISNHYKFK